MLVMDSEASKWLKVLGGYRGERPYGENPMQLRFDIGSLVDPVTHNVKVYFLSEDKQQCALTGKDMEDESGKPEEQLTTRLRCHNVVTIILVPRSCKFGRPSHSTPERQERKPNRPYQNAHQNHCSLEAPSLLPDMTPQQVNSD
jgi:hypothetical protein